MFQPYVFLLGPIVLLVMACNTHSTLRYPPLQQSRNMALRQRLCKPAWHFSRLFDYFSMSSFMHDLLFMPLVNCITTHHFLLSAANQLPKPNRSTRDKDTTHSHTKHNTGVYPDMQSYMHRSPIQPTSAHLHEPHPIASSSHTRRCHCTSIPKRKKKPRTSTFDVQKSLLR
ncbi:unnamed protein product [Periconia digitata]|uniref:Secreted protein n=1 Tax=Periconia digitata TaxID=1303443 RepID=A0A9W4XGA9_9PLEO|nr:unnamed protein product [Periconia digitata]